MGSFGGINIDRQDLVFGFDNGNPVANKSISTRYYKGEPTINLVNSTWSNWGVDGSGQGSIGTRTILTSTHCSIVDVSSNTRQSISFSGISANTTYTFSVKFKKISGTPTLRFQIQPYNNDTFIASYFPTTAQIGISDIDGWQTANYTITTPANTNRFIWFMQDGDDYTTYTHSFELKEVQCEAKSYPTPFIAGTRSATNSLIDLTKLSSISTSTVSFNSNGLPTFDGTDDYLDTTKTATQLGIYDANYTMECVVYFNSVTNDHMIFGTTQSALRQGMHIGCRNGTIYQGHYSADYSAGSVAINTYYHLVWTYNKSTSTATIYKNGVSQGSGGISSFIGTTNILIGRFISSYCNAFIPVSKIYSRVLTPTEIASNFKAYQKRFNI
jgi:hypothetical protein